MHGTDRDPALQEVERLLSPGGRFLVVGLATYAELRRAFDDRLPGTRMRRHLGFRYTATWTKPS